MNASLIEILDKFLVVIWPMLRLSAFLAFTSIFSARAVNMRIRISLAFAMSFFVTQYIEIPKIDPVTADGLMEIFRQILIGFTMGLVFQVASAALVVAGQAISGSMGLSMANMVDPNMGSVPVLSQFFNIMGTLIFLGMGGHLIVFGLVIESFKLLPIGQPFFSQDMLGKMINWSSMMFLGALLIALPVLMTLLFINVGLGFVARAAPSLNIFTVGFPALILTGFIVMIFSMTSNVARIDWVWTQAFMMLRSYLGG
ncbi:MAG: flagellar biosynthetic protein FliR [Burkholderiales bacterium 35-55-47]|jgi:flagellar biosynthetic protein FliR|uniref:flagellar biosynthetic protein FliR n=1 Tax=Limnohabitans sp. TaxID=1907725 RepID=UPI000BCFC074|nr:flagellar biosynthetic protein FliR [Limnohabitans sp.]OYY19089.1 MAG: flagellar biosynthetic protein FliR [Burkholderiales bacterium 35-55-47]OYZ73098.1 MAG: flagellar biosynthetic protein FliR [Burkholderiales bacterium 24-55-52]OZB00385.1 MAG: flagellar biosynthetic protein FliR [Burkholderiales bacterium 39-55-53]HQR87393.1 flagellar biosynthetic protein FliR [Limnohabitans sp.]HQS26815.1 flagellar biosynthetic protein FliR [Limnohabitans sp.]